MGRYSQKIRRAGPLIGSKTVFAIIVLVATCAALGGGAVWTFGTDELVTIAVTGKERVTEASSEGHVTSRWLVFCESEVFQVSDVFLRGHWSASDTYRKLEVGRTYDVLVHGWRMPLLSTYRNILEVR